MSDETLLHDALHKPHDPAERMDPDFMVTYRCDRCGRLGMGPRKYLREAVQEHLARCPVINKRQEDAVRLYFPRSN